MKNNNAFITTMVTLILVLVILIGGCATVSQWDILDTEIGHDAGTLRNIQRISDDNTGKGWLAVSRDGNSLLYNEFRHEYADNRRTRERTHTFTNTVIYLRNAQVFAKTPLAISSVTEFTIPRITRHFTSEQAIARFNSELARHIATAPGPAVFHENGVDFLLTEAATGGRHFVRANVNTTAKTFITRNVIGAGDGFPSIRDGVIVFQEGGQIIMMREDGFDLERTDRGGQRLLLPRVVLGPGEQPSWHPTEDRIVFVRDGSIMEMDVNAAQQTQIFGVSPRERQDGIGAGFPSFTMDGQHIVFLRTVRIGTNRNRQTGVEIPIIRQHLFAMNADGSNLTEITSGNLNITWYGLGQDNRVFFISDAGGRSEIWSASIALGN